MLCLSVFLQCSVAYAANFIEVHRSDKYLISIDVSSLKDHGDYVTVWEKWIYRGVALKEMKKYQGNMAYDLQLKAYKKSDKECQIMAFYNYSEDGKCLSSNQAAYDPYNFKPLVPNSLGEYLWERIMALTNN